MPSNNRIPFDLPGFEIDHVDDYPNLLVVQAHSIGNDGTCPDCGQRSSRVHSHYTRSPRDLPSCGRKVRLVLGVRRFRCPNNNCERKTFAERIPHIVPVHGQRTQRLTATLHNIAFELSAEAGARVTRHLNMAVSGDTLLRILHQTPNPPVPFVRVLGIDDWAYKKGRQYGTLLVDLELHRPIDLLPDRTTETLATWLNAHPEVEIVTRDRSSEYIAGVIQGAAQAIQVADRWHLLHNLGEALHRMFIRHTKTLRTAAQMAHEQLLGQATLPPDPVEAPPEPISHTPEQPPRTYRQARFAEVKALFAQGYSQNSIARQLKMHRQTVARYVRLDELPKRATPTHNISTVAPYMAYIQRRWAEGCHNGKQLWREICAQGYTGSYMSVYRALKPLRGGDGRRRKTLPPSAPPLSPRQAMWLLANTVDRLNSDQIIQLAALCACCPVAANTYTLVQRFGRMIRERRAEDLDPWLNDAIQCEIPALSNFAVTLQRDYAAVKAALTLEWSNGQVEGQVNRLKVIKRMMYGRAKFDLLRLRVLHPP
jgi:transposase